MTLRSNDGRVRVAHAAGQMSGASDAGHDDSSNSGPTLYLQLPRQPPGSRPPPHCRCPCCSWRFLGFLAAAGRGSSSQCLPPVQGGKQMSGQVKGCGCLRQQYAPCNDESGACQPRELSCPQRNARPCAAPRRDERLKESLPQCVASRHHALPLGTASKE